MISTQATTLTDWTHSAYGSYALAWEQVLLDEWVSELFGYYALQLGLPQLDALRNNRVTQRWLATQQAHPMAAVVMDWEQLPLAESSVDLLVLPHTLERSANPHATLRDAARALVPGGVLIATGFQCRAPGRWPARVQQLAGLPCKAQTISQPRLADWLALLHLHVENTAFYGYRPLATSTAQLARTAFADDWGAKLWPSWGKLYAIQARKQVVGAKLLQPAWQHSRLRAAAPVVSTHAPSSAPSQPRP